MSLYMKRSKAIGKGIADAEYGTPAESLRQGMKFIREYAKTHYRFNGGDVLFAWRKTGAELSKVNWRNRWGALMKRAEKEGILLKVGMTKPTASQSHTSQLVLWESKIYEE